MDLILPLLRQNARASLSDLAKASNSTEGEVSAHIKQLEDEGVILGYQAIVDPQKMAKERVAAVIEVKITPEREGGFDKMAERIARFPEVLSCYLMSGGYDLLVVVEGATLHAVVSTATHFRLKAYKENGVELKKEAGPQRLSVSP